MKLPDCPFDEIALRLYHHAMATRSAYNTAEVWIARSDDGVSLPLDELRADAETAGQLYEFFRAAAPHEELIRDFMAGLADDRVVVEAKRARTG